MGFAFHRAAKLQCTRTDGMDSSRLVVYSCNAAKGPPRLPVLMDRSRLSVESATLREVKLTNFLQDIKSTM